MSQNYSLVSSLPFKIFLSQILAQNSLKMEIELFPQCAILHKNQSLSLTFCPELQLFSNELLGFSLLGYHCYRECPAMFTVYTQAGCLQLPFLEKKKQKKLWKLKFVFEKIFPSTNSQLAVDYFLVYLVITSTTSNLDRLQI